MTIRPELLDRPPDSSPNFQDLLEERGTIKRLTRTRSEQRASWLLSPLWLCLLVALMIRVWFALRTHGTLDGDEALLGIQAEHILRGERPIYFYGIPILAAWKPMWQLSFLLSLVPLWRLCALRRLALHWCWCA
jgi:hypothetical protein